MTVEDLLSDDDLTVWLNLQNKNGDVSLEAWCLKRQTRLQKRKNCEFLTWLANGYRVIADSEEYCEEFDTNHTLKIEYSTGEELFKIPMDSSYFSENSAYFALQNDKFLVLASEQNKIGILDTVTNSTNFIQAPQDINLNISAFLKEGSIVSSGRGPDRPSSEVVIWNYENSRYDFSMDCGVACKKLVALSDSTFLAIGDFRVEDDITFVNVCNMARGQTELRRLKFENQIHFKVLPDGTLLTQERGAAGTFNLWELQEGKLLKTFVNPDIRSLSCVHQTQTTLYIASDQTLFAYDRSELGMANKPKGLRF